MRSNLLDLIQRRLIYFDVGARGGLGEPWKSFDRLIQLVAFEPDFEEYSKLIRDSERNGNIYHNYALFRDSRDLSLNLTRTRGCSSIYEPNYDFLTQFPESSRFYVDKQVTVEAISLDELAQQGVIGDVDFIKVDVQGAGLDVLAGGRKLLSNSAIGLEIEVEFQPIYEKQPLFADVDAFIREDLGLEIQDLRKTYWKYSQGVGWGGIKGKAVFGDALYLRSPIEILEWCSGLNKSEASQKLSSACLTGIVYGYLDYSLLLLDQEQLIHFWEPEYIQAWRQEIYQYARNLGYHGKGSGRLSGLFRHLYRTFQPAYRGWASIDNHLGLRKKYNSFV
jgi:FkbM family methyltransferase